jgi:hypothetical protein
MLCSACRREIDGTPLVFGPLTLCPKGCIPEPQPDLSAQVEHFAIEAAKKAATRRSYSRR